MNGEHDWTNKVHEAPGMSGENARSEGRQGLLRLDRQRAEAGQTAIRAEARLRPATTFQPRGPTESRPWGWIRVSGIWTATGLGRALATLLIAGYAGLARRQLQGVPRSRPWLEGAPSRQKRAFPQGVPIEPPATVATVQGRYQSPPICKDNLSYHEICISDTRQ